ncbi:unnamed protein product, partial [Brassica oleracea]
GCHFQQVPPRCKKFYVCGVVRLKIETFADEIMILWMHVN